MKKVNGFSMYMKKRYFERKSTKRYIHNKENALVFSGTKFCKPEKYTYILNISVYKLSFYYFHHYEIYLLHENFHKFSLEGLHKT